MSSFLYNVCVFFNISPATPRCYLNVKKWLALALVSPGEGYGEKPKADVKNHYKLSGIILQYSSYLLLIKTSSGFFFKGSMIDGLSSIP